MAIEPGHWESPPETTPPEPSTRDWMVLVYLVIAAVIVFGSIGAAVVLS